MEESSNGAFAFMLFVSIKTWTMPVQMFVRWTTLFYDSKVLKFALCLKQVHESTSISFYHGNHFTMTSISSICNSCDIVKVKLFAKQTTVGSSSSI